MKSLLFWPSVALICFFTFLDSYGQQEEKQPLNNQPQWQLSLLLAKQTEVPNMVGKTFQEFGDAYWLESGMLIFWGRFGKENNDWGLYSLMDGEVKTVLIEGEKVVPPNFFVKSSTTPKERELRFHRFTPVHFGKSLLYLSIENQNTVYGWDGKYFTKILGKNDTLTIGTLQYKIKKASVATMTAQNDALIYYEASSPKKKGWILYDESTFIPQLSSDDTLRGIQGRISKMDFDAFPTVWMKGDTTLAVLERTSPFGSFKRALFRITRDKVEKIIGSGDRHPLDPKKSIDDIVRIEVANPNTFVIQTQGTHRGVYVWGVELILYHDKQFYELFNIDIAGSAAVVVGRLNFMGTLPQLIFETITDYRPDFYVFEGERSLRKITEGLNINWKEFRSISGYYNGIIIGGFIIISSSFHAKDYYFVDFGSKEITLKKPPEIITTDNKTVSLASIVGEKKSNEFIVQLDDGLYLLQPAVKN